MEKWKSDLKLKTKKAIGGKEMGYINPLFSKSEIMNKKLKPLSSKTNRKTRNDKTHNIKFPIDSINQIKLKSYSKEAKRICELQGKDGITQTKFNTALLRYGLKHIELVKWCHTYKDTKVYMHTNLLKTEYELFISGPHGLSVQKNLNDRRVVFHIINSLINLLDKGEVNIEEIIQ
ncbi:hypothetical protein V6C20_06910 [Caldibacillus thermoamylovorans]